MADVVQVTIVGSQGEADVICSLLRAYEIRCADRAADVWAERGGGFGGWREILVSPEISTQHGNSSLPSKLTSVRSVPAVFVLPLAAVALAGWFSAHHCR